MKGQEFNIKIDYMSQPLTNQRQTGKSNQERRYKLSGTQVCLVIQLFEKANRSNLQVNEPKSNFSNLTQFWDITRITKSVAILKFFFVNYHETETKKKNNYTSLQNKNFARVHFRYFHPLNSKISIFFWQNFFSTP